EHSRDRRPRDHARARQYRCDRHDRRADAQRRRGGVPVLPREDRMTTTKQQKVRIGLFTIVTGVLVAVVLVTFGGVHFWKTRHRYYTELDSSVYGLEKGA